MFHERVQPSPATRADRQPRVEIALHCEVRQGTRPWRKVTLEDLSAGGFRIASLPGHRAELPLRIRIPGMELLSARIRWSRANAVGCEFASPLHVAVFDHLVRRAREAG